MPKQLNRSKGTEAEQSAAAYLERNGYSIVERNARTRFGEIDIIAAKDNVLVFVEVKAKGSSLFGLPEEMITAKKKKKLNLLTRAYIADKKFRGQARIDVIAMDHQGLRHYENAF